VIREGREPGEFFYTFIKSKGLIGNRKKTIPKKSVRAADDGSDILERARSLLKKSSSSGQEAKSDFHSFSGTSFSPEMKRSTQKRPTYSLNRIENLLKEIIEIHAHVKYSMKHIDERIDQIQTILKKLDAN